MLMKAEMQEDNKSEHSTDDDGDSPPQKANSQYQPLNSKQFKEECPAAKRLLAQALVTGAVMISSASCGMPVGYSAVLLPQLKSANGSMKIDEEIGSWIASVHSAATPFGSLLSGLIMDQCGRKLALQIASLPLILGWALIGLSENHLVLLLGRLIAGLSAGLAAAAGQVLIGEISEPHLRGILTSVPFASYSFGILLIYALGSLLPWRIVAGISVVLPTVSIVSFLFLPESPVWLVRQNRIEKAKKALTWLRGGNTAQAKQETEHLIERIEREGTERSKTGLASLLEPQVLKPFIILNVFNCLQILSGTYLIVFYAVDIISHIENSMDHFLAAVLTAAIRFLFSILSSVLLALLGRRTLALSSGIGTTVSALFLSIFLQQSCPQSGNIIAIFLLIYVATNTVGFMILPGVMVGELFPGRVRGLAGGITFMIFNSMLFGVAKVFPLVKGLIGVNGVFCVFGISGLAATCFLYLTLPETKGSSLAQIEDYFKQSNFTWMGRHGKFKGGKEDETERLAA